MRMKALSALLAGLLASAGAANAAEPGTPWLKVDASRHYLEAGDRPFFWMGDTAWLLLSRLNREETEHYLRTRHGQPL